MKIIVTGGGVIGLSIAWRLCERGDEVTLVDPEPGRGASWVAGGMLAPVAEAYQGEEAITALGVAAAARWPAWVHELRQASGRDPGYSRHGTLVVARDADELALLRPLHEVQRAQGLTADLVTSREARKLEPALTPGIRGGLWLADDHQVDNRAYVGALIEACRRAGVQFAADRVSSIDDTGVATESGVALAADHVVVASGAWSLLDVPVRPVKGQIIRLRGTSTAVFPTRTIRGLDVYVVPRDNGEIAIGATSEEKGFDTTVTAGAVRHLLTSAWELLPSLAEADFVEAAAGLRPGTPDNAPIIGPAGDRPNVTLAMGHYRHGVLFSPVTAEAVCSIVHGEDAPEVIAPFTPSRFLAVSA